MAITAAQATLDVLGGDARGVAVARLRSLCRTLPPVERECVWVMSGAQVTPRGGVQSTYVTPRVKISANSTGLSANALSQMGHISG